jgi:hypothetical protein
MFKRFLFLYGFFSSLITFAQPSIQWQKCLGGKGIDIAKSIIQTNDGGYLIAGSTTSIDGDVTKNHDTTGNNSDIWLIKLDADGNLQWQKCIGGTGGDYATSLIKTTDGGYAIAGYTWSTDGDANGDINHFSADFWVIKLSATDTIQWQKKYGGYADDVANSIYQTADGGYVVAGYTQSHDGDVTVFNGKSDFWVIKIDTSGVLQWQKTYGGSGVDVANSIIQTHDGGYLIAGFTDSPDSEVSGLHLDYFGDTTMDYWVVKTNDTGAIEWAKCYGGGFTDNATSVIQTSDGGYMVAGFSDFGPDSNGYYNYYDYWLVKIDTAGNIQWQNRYGGIENDVPYTVLQTHDGGYIISGCSVSDSGEVTGNHGRNDYWILKTDGNGKMLSGTCFGGSMDDIPYSIIETNDGSFAIAGSTQSNDGNISGFHDSCAYNSTFSEIDCNPDFWIVKLNLFPSFDESTTIQTSLIYLYPNPFETQGTFIVNADVTNKNAAINIYDVLGQEVKTLPMADNTNYVVFNRAGLTNGIYFYHLFFNGSPTPSRGKIVIY